MDDLVNYVDVVIGDKVDFGVNHMSIFEGKGNVKIMDWAPKADYVDWNPVNELKFDKDGFIYINGNKYTITLDGVKPVEKRGLYDLCIDNHVDIPESISKDSPCYKQFMKELNLVKRVCFLTMKQNMNLRKIILLVFLPIHGKQKTAEKLRCLK